ncbi:LysR substrate-binding domain-containing protein [Halomonas sp. 86]|uniref:LysR substrate-binding domain-containing protein n=1 Tax=unclassified Halomonas TaxID=2609666 RepID=UPI004034D4BE
MTIPNLNDLYYFVQVVDHEGFAPAGRALGIAKSKLSRHVGELEKQLGVLLLHRSTRHLRMTDIGQRYYLHCKAMLEEVEAAQQVIEESQSGPCGIIRLSCPTGLLNFHVSKMLADFMSLYPQVHIHLEATNRHVDPLTEGIDIAIRARPLPFEDSDLFHKVLSANSQCLVASPKLLSRYGKPKAPCDLARFPSISRARPVEQHAWRLQRNEHIEVIEHTPRFITTDMTALYHATLAGIGIAQMPKLVLPGAIDSGQLTLVLPEWELRQEVIHAVYLARRELLPSVRVLLDFMVERYAELEL